MRKRKLISGIALAIGLSTSNSQAASLQDIYLQALENDHQLKADRAALEAGLESSKIARANLLPQINASAAHTETDYDYNGFSNSFGGNINSSGEVDNDTYQLSLTQPLFDMSAWYSYQQGKAVSKQAEAQFGADQQSVIIRVAEAYFNVLRAIDNLETAKAEENALSHQLEQTKQRFDVGLTAITDVHEAQAAYDTATAATLEARGALGIAFEEIEVLTGSSPDSIAPLLENFPITNPEPADRSAWVDFSLQNNYSLKVAHLNYDASRQSARAAASNHLPTISASINYVDMDDTNTEVDTAGFGTAYPDERYTDQSTIAVQLDVPIFSGLRTSSERRQAQQLQVQSMELFNQTQRDIIQNTRSLHLSVMTNVAQINARKQAITSSRSALEATQAGYDVGTRNLVDVLLAQQNLYEAQRSYDETRYDYVLDMLRLKEVAGSLSPDDVSQLNRWLETAKPVLRSSYEAR